MLTIHLLKDKLRPKENNVTTYMPKNTLDIKNAINLPATQTLSSHCKFCLQKRAGRGGTIYLAADIYLY